MIAAVACFGVLWLVIGIGGGTADVPQPSREAEQRAAQLWRSFPVDTIPRPIVLIIGPIDGPEGFRSGDSEAAFEARRLVVHAHVPGELQGVRGQALIAGQQALRELLRRPTRSVGRDPRHLPTLTIDSISLGTGTFMTDRGVRRLPAWRFYLRGFAQPALVLALAGRRVYSRPNLARATQMVADNSESVIGTESSNTLRVTVFGAPAGQGPCQAAYRISSAATSRAVAVGVTERDNPPAAGQGCLGVAESDTFTMRLQGPLGHRVVVASPSGGAIAVSTRR